MHLYKENHKKKHKINIYHADKFDMVFKTLYIYHTIP